MAFSYLRNVYLADTDAAGVVYFASVMKMCHEAYEESLAAEGISLRQFLSNSSVVIPIVHAEASFFHPLFCGDKLAIALTGEQLSINSFVLNYQVAAAAAVKPCLAKVQTKHVCINPITRSRSQLPPVIIDWLKNFT